MATKLSGLEQLQNIKQKAAESGEGLKLEGSLLVKDLTQIWNELPQWAKDKPEFKADPKTGIDVNVADVDENYLDNLEEQMKNQPFTDEEREEKYKDIVDQLKAAKNAAEEYAKQAQDAVASKDSDLKNANAYLKRNKKDAIDLDEVNAEITEIKTERIQVKEVEEGNGTEVVSPLDRNSKSDLFKEIKSREKTFEQQIEEIDTEIQRRQRIYVEMRLEKEKKYKQIYGFFEKHLQGKAKESLEKDKDIEQTKAWYNEALKQRRLMLLDNASKNNSSKEDILKIMADHVDFSQIEMANTYDKVLESKKGSLWGGKIEKFMNQTADAYRKLPVSKKIAIGLTFAGIGFAGAALGGTATGVAGSLLLCRRAFMSFVSGKGAAIAKRGFDERKRNKEKEQLLKEFDLKLESMSPAERMEAINTQLEKLENETGASFEEIKRKRKNSTLIGFGVGALAFTMPSILRTYANDLNFDLSKVSFFDDSLKMQSAHVSSLDSNGTLMSAHETAADVASNAEALKNVSMTIEKGSSFEGTLIDYLKTHREDLLKHHPEFAKFDNGQIAHRLALDFAHDFNLPDGKLPDIVQPGQKMTLNLETLNIEVPKDSEIGFRNTRRFLVEMSEEVPDDMEGDGAETTDIAEDKLKDELVDPSENQSQNTSESVPETNKSESIPFDQNHEYRKIETEMAVEDAIVEADAKYAEAADPSNFKTETPPIENFEKMGQIDNVRKELRELLRDMQVEDAPWQGMNTTEELLNNGAGSHQLLHASLEKITTGAPNKLAYWKEIKDVQISEVLFKTGGNGESVHHKGILGLVKEYQAVIGEKALPLSDESGKSNETVGKWLGRITKLALQERVK